MSITSLHDRSQPDDMGADLDSIVSSSTATTSSTSTSSPSQLVLSRTTSSLVSTVCSGTSSCTCYQCSRRHHHHHHQKKPSTTTTTKDCSWHSEIDAGLKQYNIEEENITTTTTTTTTTKHQRSMLQRKRPTIHSYNKHLPRPPYAPNDSIYRAHMKPAAVVTSQQPPPPPPPPPCSDKNGSPSSCNDHTRWFDDTSNVDLVLSFMVFDTIVADQPDDSIFGLTDLIEERTKQLHDSLFDTAEDEAKDEEEDEEEEKNRHDDNGGIQGSTAAATATSSSSSASQPSSSSSPAAPICKKKHPPSCHTLSSREGPTHHPLTLFHTMKLVNAKERLETFGTYSISIYHHTYMVILLLLIIIISIQVIAYDHCIRANSGLTNWIKKRRGPPEILCSK